MADPTTGTDPAAIFTYIGYAIGGVVAVVVARLGWNSGKPSSPAGETKPGELVEIRSAIVDTNALDRLTAAIEGHSLTLLEVKAEAKKVEEAMGQFLDQLHGLTDELRTLSREIRELSRETSKKS